LYVAGGVGERGYRKQSDIEHHQAGARQETQQGEQGVGLMADPRNENPRWGFKLRHKHIGHEHGT